MILNKAPFLEFELSPERQNQLSETIKKYMEKIFIDKEMIKKIKESSIRIQFINFDYE